MYYLQHEWPCYIAYTVQTRAEGEIYRIAHNTDSNVGKWLTVWNSPILYIIGDVNLEIYLTYDKKIIAEVYVTPAREIYMACTDSFR